MTKRIDNIIRHIADHRWPWLAALALVTAILGAGLLRLEIATAPDDFIIDGSEEQADYNLLRDTFGSDETGLVLIEVDDPFDPGALRRYIELHEKLGEVPLVADGGYVQSLLTSRDTNGLPLLTTETDLTNPELAQRILDAPLIENRLYSTEAGRSYLALITRIPAGPTAGSYWEGAELASYGRGVLGVVDDVRAPGFEPIVASEAVIGVRATENGGQLLGLALAGQLALLLAAIGYCYGWRVTILPAAIILISVVWTLGLMGWAGAPMDGFAQFLPNLIVVAGVADAMHLIHRFSVTWGPENDQQAAAADATIDKTKAIVFTSLTSAAGFASFALGGFRPFAIVGAFGAFAVLAAMTVSLVLAPAVMPRLIKRPARTVVSRLGDAAVRIANWSAKHAVAISLATAFICLVSVLGVIRTDISFDGEDLVGDVGGTDEVARIADLQNGAIPIQVMYTNSSGVLSEAGRDRVEEITQLVTSETVGGAPLRAEPSIWQAIDAVEEILDTVEPGGGERSAAESVELALLEQPESISALIDESKTALRLPFTAAYVAQTRTSRDIADLQQQLDKFATDTERIIVTGSAVASGRSAETALPSVVRSYGIAVAAIAVLVAIVVRGRQRAFIAMVPNILPAFLLLGFLGVVGLPVDLVLIQIAAIVIGISVDDTIHIIHDAYLDPNRSDSLSSNLARSMRETGPALILTSVLVAVGLIAMALLPIPSYARVGPIGGVAVLLALAADLIVLPALMSLLDDLETET